MSIRLWWEQFNNSVMFLFCLLSRVSLAPPDSPWSNSLLWGSWVVRRILMISPASSLHAHTVVLVFARAKMCWHFPLFSPSNAHRESYRLLSHSFPVTEKSAGHLLGRRLFTFSSIILSMGRCDSVHDDLRPCGGSGLPHYKKFFFLWQNPSWWGLFSSYNVT